MVKLIINRLLVHIINISLFESYALIENGSDCKLICLFPYVHYQADASE